MNDDERLRDELRRLYMRLWLNQTTLGPAASEILYGNLWNLYEGEPSAPKEEK